MIPIDHCYQTLLTLTGKQRKMFKKRHSSVEKSVNAWLLFAILINNARKIAVNSFGAFYSFNQKIKKSHIQMVLSTWLVFPDLAYLVHSFESQKFRLANNSQSLTNIYKKTSVKCAEFSSEKTFNKLNQVVKSQSESKIKFFKLEFVLKGQTFGRGDCFGSFARYL